MKSFWLIMAMMMQLSMVRAGIKITVLSDIHVMSPELVVKDGKAWQEFLAQKLVMLDFSKQLFDEEVERLLKEKPDMVLITDTPKRAVHQEREKGCKIGIRLFAMIVT